LPAVPFISVILARCGFAAPARRHRATDICCGGRGRSGGDCGGNGGLLYASTNSAAVGVECELDVLCT
jgi:hypothetical protein